MYPSAAKSAFGLAMISTFDLWPWKAFFSNMGPLTWWLFVASFVGISPLRGGPRHSERRYSEYRDFFECRVFRGTPPKVPNIATAFGISWKHMLRRSAQFLKKITGWAFEFWCYSNMGDRTVCAPYSIPNSARMFYTVVSVFGVCREYSQPPRGEGVKMPYVCYLRSGFNSRGPFIDHQLFSFIWSLVHTLKFSFFVART